MNDVLQVPMSKELRKKATLAALNQGYSSLQESVRIYLRQLADNKIAQSRLLLSSGVGQNIFKATSRQ